MAPDFITVRLYNGTTIVVNTAHITHVTASEQNVATIWLSDGKSYAIADSIADFTLHLTEQHPNTQP